MALAAGRMLADHAALPRWHFRATLSSIGWLATAQAASGMSMFAVSLLRARALTLDEFGTYALVATVVAFLSIVADFGLSVMMVRDLSGDGVDRRAYLNSAFVLTAALALTASVAVFGSSLAITRDTGVAPLAGVLAISVLLVGLAVAPVAFLRATGRTSVETIARILSGATLVGLTTLAVASHSGVVAFGAAAVASSAVALVVMLPAALRAAGATRPRIDLAHWRGLLIDAAPLGIAMLFTAVYYYADSLMLGAFGQREALARYNAAYVFVLAVAMVIAALRNGFLPAQAQGHAADVDLGRVLTVYFRITAMLAVPLVIIGPIVAAGALRVVYGPAYVPAAGALRQLLVTAGVMCFSSYFGSNLLLCGRQRAYLTATIVGAFANVALNVVLIPRYSLSGAASATLAAEAGVCVFVAMQNRAFAPPQFVRALVLPAAISCAVAAPLALGLARVGML